MVFPSITISAIIRGRDLRPLYKRLCHTLTDSLTHSLTKNYFFFQISIILQCWTFAGLPIIGPITFSENFRLVDQEHNMSISLCVIFKHEYLVILSVDLKFGVIQKFLIFINFLPVLEFSSYLLWLLRYKR